MESEDLNKTVLFYDGDCGFCNRSVQLVLNNEKSDRIHFTALQSEFAQNYFLKETGKLPDLSSFYFLEDGKLYNRAAAVFKVLKYLKWYWQILYIFKIIPLFIRNKLYDFIAKRRKNLVKTYCAVPSKAQSLRFIR